MALPLHQPSGVLIDAQARRVEYLRLSLTDRCNFRCTYCVPDGGVVFGRRAELLTFEEIERVVRLFARHGVRRVRLTGGEPTVRAGVVGLVQRLAAIERADGGPLELVMTTNGHLLAGLAEPLARAGLRGANISLDTLDPQKFRELTRGGAIETVLGGIEAAVAAGLEVKLNAVALRQTNGDEVVSLCRFAWDLGIVPRFIEHMPMSCGQLYQGDRHLGAAEIRTMVERQIGASLEPVEVSGAVGPARYFRLTDGSERRLGVVSALSEHFCATCNRVRLTATGDLHVCLGYDDKVSLRDPLRDGASDEELFALICGALDHKRPGHELRRTGAGAPKTDMVSIGG